MNPRTSTSGPIVLIASAALLAVMFRRAERSMRVQRPTPVQSC